MAGRYEIALNRGPKKVVNISFEAYTDDEARDILGRLAKLISIEGHGVEIMASPTLKGADCLVSVNTYGAPQKVNSKAMLNDDGIAKNLTTNDPVYIDHITNIAASKPYKTRLAYKRDTYKEADEYKEKRKRGLARG